LIVRHRELLDRNRWQPMTEPPPLRSTIDGYVDTGLGSDPQQLCIVRVLEYGETASVGRQTDRDRAPALSKVRGFVHMRCVVVATVTVVRHVRGPFREMARRDRRYEAVSRRLRGKVGGDVRPRLSIIACQPDQSIIAARPYHVARAGAFG